MNKRSVLTTENPVPKLVGPEIPILYYCLGNFVLMVREIISQNLCGSTIQIYVFLKKINCCKVLGFDLSCVITAYFCSPTHFLSF